MTNTMATAAAIDAANSLARLADAEKSHRIVDGLRAKERRERIATAVLAGMLAGVDGEDSGLWSEDDAALHALRYTDALIKALDQ